MKTNKKAILGMLVAMIMSLGVMGGINTKSNDSNLMNVSVAAGLYAGSEGGATGAAWAGVAAFYGGAAGTFIQAGLAIAITPAGWATLGLGAVLLG